MSGDALNTQSPGPGNGEEPSPGVGRLLRASRLRCGEELSDVADMLRIRYAYLEAIEEDRFQDLPGQAYAIGFIRAYAEHLGLDSAEVVRRFKEDSAGVEKTNLDFPVPFPEKGIPGGAILFVGVAIAVLAYGGWYLNTTYEGRFMDLISPLPERLASLAGKDDAAEAGPSPVTATADELTPAATGDGGQAQATTEPGPRESGVEQGIERIPPRFGPETAAEVTLSPGPPAEAAVTPPGTIETDRGSGLAPVPAEAEGGGPGEAVPAEVGAAKPPEAADALGTARGEGEAAGIGRPDAATGAEEETPATGGPERATAEAQVQGETRPAMGDAEPDAAGTEQAAAPPATGEVEPDAAGTEQAAAPPATGEVEQDTAGTEQAAEPPATGDAGQAPAAPAADEPEQAAVQAAAASSRGRVFGADNENSRIEVRAIMNSWIQVRDDADNRLLVTRMLRAGDSYRVPDRRGLKLLTGNAGALEILVDGEVVPSIGPVGKVLRAVALDTERLRRGSAVDD
ncbi:MAG: DUF4115 domain-containing protein [Proteobacteria bacterium]|nr:DUF4115 domain-containing protein [Pseudomonadota bacterium]